MLEDIKLKYDEINNEIDLEVLDNAGDVTTEPGLETAVLISLYTDRRARDDDPVSDEETNKRGWWGDLVSPEEVEDQIGSRKWIFWERGKTTEQVMEDVKEADYEALQWLIDDGIASEIIITIERDGIEGNDRLEELIEIIKPDGESFTYNTKFDALWIGQENQ